MDFLIEIALDIVCYLFLSGEDHEWSIVRTSITLAIVIGLMFLAYWYCS